MIDRRLLVSTLAAWLAAAGADAAQKKKTTKKTASKKTASKSSGKKGKAEKATKGKKGKAAPKKPSPPPAPPPPPPPPPVPDESAPAVLAALTSAFDAILRDLLLASPLTATANGLDKGEYAALRGRLDDRSDAAKAATVTRLKRAVDRLNAIDRSQLNAGDRINYDTVLWDFSNQLALARNFDFGDYGTLSGGFPNPYVISQLSGAYQSIPDFLDTQHPIETAADAEAYLKRLAAFATLLDQETDRAKRDMARGIVPPDFILKTALKQLNALRDTDPATSRLINSIDERTTAKGIAPGAAGPWKDRAAAIVTGPVKEALQRQIDLLVNARSTARHDAGVRNLNNGDAYYAQCVKLNTSTDLTPAQVHTLGLQKVADLTAEMDTRFRQMGMTQGSVADRIKAMYADPKYLYPNTDEGKAKLLGDLQAKVDAVEARLPRYFGVLPKAKLQIRRVPVATEAGAPGGYYNPGAIDGARPGAYYINLRDTAEVPSWTLPTLTYHEGVPGHHLQGTIQQEAQGLPMLRKLSGFNAYVEGWALYSEQLAGEMGMYDNDPAGRIGYLHDALFRAVRLVVDTGMHAMGWSREQAIAYMIATSANAEGDATAEIERYVVWPGQALGYMVGKLTWLRLRDAMKAKQGAAFDIKAFHDAGLLCGAVPLDVLEDVYKAKGLI